MWGAPRSALRATTPIFSTAGTKPSVSACSSCRTPTHCRSTKPRAPQLAELSKSFPPGIKYVIAFDTTTVVGDSVREVVTTLEEAILIVIIVIFLFLLDWRATIIPAVTIPVSLIGTFAFIKIFGFSINSLTLFGITLATGLVVDDAIVVIENVQRHINEDGTDSHTATSVAMTEVSSAVIATSLVLISVFVPVSFFPGTTGILYKQFSLTIAFSIAISLFNALTLSPALAAILLRSEEHKYSVLRLDRTSAGCRADTAAFAHGVDRAIHGLGTAYGKVISKVLEYRYAVIVLFLVGTGGDRLHVHSCSHRFRAAGGPELLHRGGAGAAGSVAFLHHQYRTSRRRRFCGPIPTSSAPSRFPASRSPAAVRRTTDWSSLR